MIVVKVELHSAITGDVSNLGTVVIDNIGGGNMRGDYRVRSYRKGTNVIKTRGRKGLVREGRVLNHPRMTAPVLNLVRKSLSALEF